jgi:small subunit ribosomal protein S17
MTDISKTTQANKKAAHKRVKEGVVVRLSGSKTAIVEVTELLSHPKYFKRYSRSKRFHAHIGGSAPAVGQAVTIIESRPHSKLKRWRVQA